MHLFLTAGAAMFWAFIIIFDPIFSGLELHFWHFCLDLVFFAVDPGGLLFNQQGTMMKVL